MSKKLELINYFKEYKNRYEKSQALVADIKKSEVYTEIGKEQAIEQINHSYFLTARFYHNKAIAAIDWGLAGLEEEWKVGNIINLKDAGYQVGLANVVKMLEMGAITDKKDVKAIIDTYLGNYCALALIKAILTKSEHKMLKECVSLIPEDNREYNRQLLKQLRDDIDKNMNENSLNMGMLNISKSMDSMTQLVNERFGDKLELIV